MRASMTGDIIIFTLWPEWRDYDLTSSLYVPFSKSLFLPCDLNEGITTFYGHPVFIMQF